MRALAVTVVFVAVIGLAWGQQRHQQQQQQQQQQYQAGGLQYQQTQGRQLHQVPNQQANQYTDPCQSKTRSSPHETQCDAYYDCHDGQPVLQYCPNGLAYQGKSSQGLFGVCDYDFNVDCSTRPQRDPPIGAEHCEWLYGIFGHETSCTRYWTCWNGTATEQFCIGGLLYNEVTHACDWPQNVGGCQKHPLCKDDPNANVPLGKSCERYWACQGGYPRLQRCPATLVFDRASRRCIAPPTPECDVPSTTPRPAQQERGQPSRQGQGQQGGQQQQQFQAQSAASQSQQRRLAQQQQRQPQPVSSRNQPQQQQFQQEQEQPPQEQFVDEAPLDDGGFEQTAPLEEQPFEEAPPRPTGRPVRPVRPQFSSSGPQLPFVPSGATPIQFGSGSGPRLPPIPGAIPIRLN